MSALITPVPVEHSSTKAIRRALEAMKAQTVEDSGHPRVLALDDNDDTLELIRTALMGEYDVVTLGNPMDTYEMIELFEPDLLIVDVMMPKITGFQLIEMLRRSPRTRELPVIILSAKDTARDIKHGYKMGANLYLTKPFDPERLIRNVKTQFEVNPAKKERKKMSLAQVQMHLQMRTASHGSTARLASPRVSGESPMQPISRQQVERQDWRPR